MEYFISKKKRGHNTEKYFEKVLKLRNIRIHMMHLSGNCQKASRIFLAIIHTWCLESPFISTFWERFSKYNGQKYLFAFHEVKTIKECYNKGPCGLVSVLPLTG